MANQPTTKGTDDKFNDNKFGDSGKFNKDIGGESRTEDKLGDSGIDSDKGTGGGALNEAKDNVKAIGAKAKNLVDSGRWDDMKDGAQQAVQKARDIASDVAGKAREQAGAAVEKATSTVKQYPFQALLVGFGVGALMGVALGKRRA